MTFILADGIVTASLRLQGVINYGADRTQIAESASAREEPGGSLRLIFRARERSAGADRFVPRVLSLLDSRES